ncbi:YceD family protein [Enterococcus dongliensis]|uniref:YceD family protein n=1 Tax=Enterococcus dongliensis TaxID=2559925 RepID=UPI00288F2710|nr:YceD family protein [Enterococcus dongliensis]MDT2670214.1 YceD family protein [Enterococcus dongliensis]
MKWSIGELRRYKEETLNFSETIDVNEALTARDNEILAVAPVTVEGILSVGKNEYILHYRLKTIVTVPSARSLEPVDLPLGLSVDEVFMTREQWSSMEEERDEEILVLDNDTIDLTDSIEDNILLAIPMQVFSEEEMQTKDLPKGNDWEVVSEEEYLQKKESAETIDPRLAKLSELFNESEDDK